MLYLVAILIPPLAVLLCGKPFQSMLNGTLWLVGIVLALLWVGWPLLLVCVIHAIGVVHNFYADRRVGRG
jgi:hypothetical protein